MVGKTTLLALGRVGPPWRPGPRPPPRRRGSHPSTVRPRSTSTITRRPYHKMMIFLLAWRSPLLNLDVFYIYMISIWYLLGNDSYLISILCVYLKICYLHRTCVLRIRTLDAQSQTLEFGQEIWQRLSINVNKMFEAISSRKLKISHIGKFGKIIVFKSAGLKWVYVSFQECRWLNKREKL